MSARPVQLVLWIVDDDIEKPAVIGPFEDCLSAFVNDVAGPNCIVEETARSTPNQQILGLLADAVAWHKVYSFPPGGIKVPPYCNRPVEFLTFGIKTWELLHDFLSGRITNTIHLPFWPHLVFTDLYKGIRQILTFREDVKKLPGYKLAVDCASRGIPCIALTSEKTAIHNFDLFYGRNDVFPVPRDQIGPVGQALDILKHRLSDNLLRRMWIPEFSLTVEGHLNNEGKKYEVIFKDNEKVVSRVNNVTPGSYGFLYVWAHASALARLKGWRREIALWDDSVCPAVSMPPTNKHGGKEAQVHVVWDDLFSSAYWKKNKATIFFEGTERHRQHTILSANIRHLEMPHKPELPACWINHPAVKTKLIQSLREILPPDAMEWLTKCCS